MILLAAFVVGSCKSLLILDTAADRIISRINEFSGTTWLPAVYSWQTWLLVVAMMALGSLLKYSLHPTIVRCFIYCTVGWGLLFSSRNMWCAFWRKRKGGRE